MFNRLFHIRVGGGFDPLVFTKGVHALFCIPDKFLVAVRLEMISHCWRVYPVDSVTVNSRGTAEVLK